MTFKRALGRFDATMIVIGGIIGSGIFINPYIVAQRLDSSALVLGAWIAGGAIALAGALSYAELGSVFPRVGGQYAYLRDAIHPLAGFLYGWALLAVIETGAIAAVAIAFATYTLRLVGQPDLSPIPLAIAALVVLSLINVLGVKPGSRVLNVLVVLKVGALAVLIAFGLFAPSAAGWFTGAKSATTAEMSGAVAFGAALVPILFAYGGWQNANYVAEEVHDPGRQLPVSIIGGTIAVVAIYVLVNVVYLRALGLEGLAATSTPAADAARHMFGSVGDRFVTAAIAISTFGFLDLAILAPTRVYYAMAADGLFFPALAKLHPAYRTPAVAIAVQTTWSCILALSGSYGQLLNYVVFADWIFFALTVSTIIVFRHTVPLSSRSPLSFRAPGYPLLPVLFVAAAAAIVLSVVWADPESASRGALLLAAGIPLFYWFVTQKRKATKTTSSSPNPTV
ncbi:MAG TPA: amino acid permease [Vicinamibacterales bacterium]|nr:amino acid permease [Vicinamibacterales bacterium]